MDKTVKSNLIAAVAVAAIPLALATYFNVRVRVDLKRIRKTNEEMIEKMHQTINSIN